MRFMRSLGLGCLVGVCLFVASEAAAGPVRFLATDGTKLYRTDSDGNIEPTLSLSAAVQSLTFVPGGFALPGASGGDVIACAHSATGGRYALYRVDDPFGVAPTLTQIGSTAIGVGSLVFANGGIYAVEDSQNPVRVYRLDPTTLNSVENWSTGISAGGGGGMAYDPEGDRFLLTDLQANRLMSWTVGSAATAIGPVGFGFSNNGMEFLDGTLYGALRPDSPGNELRMGSYDLTTGAFTTLATVTGVSGGGTGFVAIPAPAACTLLGAGLLAFRRRRS